LQDEDSSTFDIKEYIGIIRKRRYLVLSVALGVLSLLTWGSFIWPKTYEASSTLMIDKSELANPLIQGGRDTNNEEMQIHEQMLVHVRSTITSRSLIERVTKKLGLNEPIKKIQKNINVIAGGLGQRPDPDLFTITYRGRDPKTVMNFVDTLEKEFIDVSAGLQRSEVIGTYNFIDEQLSVYKKKLDDSDKTIREFRERHPEVIPQNENTMATRIVNYQTDQINTTIRLKELQRKQENLQKQLSGEKELTTAYISGDGSQANRLNDLNNQLMLLLTKYTEDYPEVIRVRSEIEEIQKQLSQPAKTNRDNAGNSAGTETKTLNPVYRQIKDELAKTDTEIESLKARLDELMNQQGEERSMLGQMPKEQEEWSKLQRDRSAYQKVYDDLLQKRETARVSKDLESTNKTPGFHVVDPPIVPRFPVIPDRIMLILIGILLGIAAGVGSAIGLDFLDPSFKNEDAVRDVLRLPVLATIPSIVTEADVQAAAKLDKKIYTAAAAYLGLIGIVFVGELLYRFAGFTIMHF
jgi:polysaccharide biosynthesis transport protein